MSKLSETDLKAIAKDPSSFFADSKNRERALGLPVNDLQDQLKAFAESSGIDPLALVKSIITEIEL